MRTKKIVWGVAIFSVGIIIADLVIVWDTVPKKTVAAKYTFNKQNLGVFPSGPIKPGPKLFNIECISETAKDCKQQSYVIPAVYTTIPEPSTLILLGLGLAGLVWRRK
jgi:hypothetical protein